MINTEIKDLNNLDHNLNNQDVIETTFRELGRKSNKNIGYHIIKENINENNLISDISIVDYTQNNKGKTHLKEIEGFDIFVDDLYIYGYLKKEDIIFNTKGKISCTTGKNGSSSYILELIRSILKQTISISSVTPHIIFTNTIELKTHSGKEGVILSTINKIEQNIDVKKQWEKRTTKKPFGVFVVKVSVSNIPISQIEKHILELQQNLFTIGYYIFSVDYTQDFSGTLHKEEVIEYLCKRDDFRKEEECKYIEGEQNVILDNESSVGKNVLTYLKKGNKNLQRVKFYNKISSNLESGEVRSDFGGHIYECINSSDTRLQNLFRVKDVQERGVTRIECSVYGEQDSIKERYGKFLIEKERKLVSTGDPLFYISSFTNHWKNLTEKIDKNFVLVDRKK